MFLIVGLGNPGNEYNNTRHNIGFASIDKIAKKYNIEINREKFKGMYGEGFIENKKVILFKPMTYMNLSGEAIKPLMDFYKLTTDDMVVIYDDISLDVGKLRIRDKGSAGGHNGVKNIIAQLGTEVFPRIKVGVGKPKGDLIQHVLGRFSLDENEILEKVLEVVISSTETIISSGAKEAMNKFNGFNATL